MELEDIATFTLERVAIDYGIELLLQQGERWITIRFETASSSTGIKIEASDPSSVCMLLNQLHEEVSKIQRYEDGSLEVAFQKQEGISVSPSNEFEAWEMVASDGMRVVCGPGGKVVTWAGKAIADSGSKS